jgi:hypothetical protein
MRVKFLFLFFILFVLLSLFLYAQYDKITYKEITLKPEDFQNSKTPETAIRMFFYYLAKNKSMTYEEEKSLFYDNSYNCKLQQDAGYRDSRGKLIKEPTESLLWNKILEKRNMFLPEDEKDICANLYFTVGNIQPVLLSRKDYPTLTDVGTIVINRFRKKEGSTRKEHYKSIIIFVFPTANDNSKISLSESVLDGKSLLDILEDKGGEGEGAVLEK